MRLRKALQEARELIRSAKDASKDNIIDNGEALDLVQDSFALTRALVGEVKLSDNAKALLRAGAAELLRALGEEKSKTVRAKFKCERAEKQPLDNGHQVSVRFDAVINDSPENKEWSKWTPSGQLQMTISNENLVDHFIQGQEYFLDIKEAK
jgi:hypothetical protein